MCGKLGDTRSAVRDDDDSDSSSKKSTSSDDSNASHDSHSSDASAVLYCLIPVVLPFCMIAWAVSDKDKESKTVKSAYFLPYPYARGRPGRLVPEEAVETRVAMPSVSNSEDEQVILLSDTPYEPNETASLAGGRFWADYFYDLDRVHVPELSFLIDTSSRLGLETNWRLYLEPLENDVDKLWMGRLHLNIRFLEDRHIEAKLGLGGRLMIDADGADGGFSSAFAFTIFPTKPLILTGEVSVGNLGRALFLEGQATVGAAFKRLELSAGYRGTWIHGPKTEVLFHGPMGTLALWF